MSKQQKFQLISALRAEGFRVTREGGRINAHAHGTLCTVVEVAGSGNLVITGIGPGAEIVRQLTHEVL